jgi:tetraacyldisaccharide 4'-kinase
LLTEYAHPFFNDHVLPTGNLREARVGARRADVVVATKCPVGLSADDRTRFEQKVQQYAGERPVFFSCIGYGDPIGFGAASTITDSIVLLTGIAHTGELLAYLQSRFKIVKHFAFPDHHAYSVDEVAAAAGLARDQGCDVLTTEKDMVRLLHPSFEDWVQSVGFFYLPIRVEWVGNGPEFDDMVLRHVNSGVKPW